MKDTQQKLNFDTPGNLGSVYWGRSLSFKDSHWKKETEFRNSVLKYIPLSDEAIKTLNDYPELVLAPDYESHTDENMVKTLNKLHGNYFFRINIGYPHNVAGIAWIGGYSGAEVEAFVMDILKDPIWVFLFTHKFWSTGSYTSYRLGETPRISLVRLEDHNVFGHPCPMDILHRNYVGIAGSTDSYNNKKIDDGRRRPFVGIPFIFKTDAIRYTHDDVRTENSTEFWDLDGEVPETINHIKRMYGNMLKYNFPKASFKVSHKAGTKKLVVAYNGVRESQIECINDLSKCIFDKYYYYNEGSDIHALFPYSTSVEFVEDKSLHLPSAAETRQRILFKVQGFRKKLELLNESNKKTLPLPENF